MLQKSVMAAALDKCKHELCMAEVLVNNTLVCMCCTCAALRTVPELITACSDRLTSCWLSEDETDELCLHALIGWAHIIPHASSGWTGKDVQRNARTNYSCGTPACPWMLKLLLLAHCMEMLCGMAGKISNDGALTLENFWKSRVVCTLAASAPLHTCIHQADPN